MYKRQDVPGRRGHAGLSADAQGRFKSPQMVLPGLHPDNRTHAHIDDHDSISTGKDIGNSRWEYILLAHGHADFYDGRQYPLLDFSAGSR